jgi:hypothetical protein
VFARHGLLFVSWPAGVGQFGAEACQGFSGEKLRIPAKAKDVAQEAEGARDVGMVSRTPRASELGHVCGAVLVGICVSVARAIGSHSSHGRPGQWAMCVVSRWRQHCARAEEEANYLCAWSLG